MDEKFEAPFNNYDEANVNRPTPVISMPYQQLSIAPRNGRDDGT
jgi:hypothetical protein